MYVWGEGVCVGGGCMIGRRVYVWGGGCMCGEGGVWEEGVCVEGGCMCGGREYVWREGVCVEKGACGRRVYIVYWVGEGGGGSEGRSRVYVCGMMCVLGGGRERGERVCVEVGCMLCRGREGGRRVYVCGMMSIAWGEGGSRVYVCGMMSAG